MSEPSIQTVPVQAPTRPFPWYCPKCRRKEVRRATIHYQCQRLFKGGSVNVELAQLSVPQCANCGELVFDYEAEEQINRAYRVQTSCLANGDGAKDSA